MALNRRQALFVSEYIGDLNASAAACCQGSAKTFRTAAQNMQKSEITDAIAAARKRRGARTDHG